MTRPRIRVLATGGTIAGKAGSALRHDYRPGQIGIEEFLSQLDGLDLEARIEGEQIANIGSENVDETHWAKLHAACLTAMADQTCAGIVITHGTDTVEETAFVLDQTLSCDKPIVLVGAMRPADAVGYDGLRNFASAVRVASSPDAAGRGVLVVMGDRVYAARDLRKARTDSTDAFAGFPRDAIGLARPSSLEWFGAPWRVGEAARFELPSQWPDVAILFIRAGLSAGIAARQIAAETRGVVVAGVGAGNMPDGVRAMLAERTRKGLTVVRASRVGEALVDREPEDDANGFIAARALTPQKARILLAMLLANGIENPVAIQAEFDKR